MARPKGMLTQPAAARGGETVPSRNLIAAAGPFLLTCLLFTAPGASARNVRAEMQKGEMRAGCLKKISLTRQDAPSVSEGRFSDTISLD